MRSMFHYRNMPVTCTEYETRTFVNLEDVAYYFHDRFNVSLSKYQLHRAIVNDIPLLGRFTLLYKQQCCKLSLSSDNECDNEEGGVPSNTSRKRCRDQIESGPLRKTRVQVSGRKTMEYDPQEC